MLALGRILILFTICVSLTTSAVAVGVDAPLDDPALEARARVIHKQLRCLVCQNQSIEDSNADLARDLRVLVRDRIALGESDKQVVDYIVDRYGDWVLLKPPLNIGTLFLWFGPLLLLAGIVFFVLIRLKRSKGRTMEGAQELSTEEQARIRKILEEHPEP
jgi:cytochrome c-type biogenesis protein CcmH